MTPPETIFSSNDSYYNKSFTLEGFSRDQFSPVIQIDGKINENTFKTVFDNPDATETKADFEFPVDITNLEEGRHTVFIKSQDNLENAEKEISYNFTVDVTAPVIEISDVIEGKFYANPVNFLNHCCSFVSKVMYGPFRKFSPGMHLMLRGAHGCRLGVFQKSSDFCFVTFNWYRCRNL